MNIAVVTGASSGMGREFVLQLKDYVAVEEIWVIARRADALAALQSQVSVPLKIIPLDLSKTESFEAYRALLAAETPIV